jgi:hypothetical protein
LSEKIHFEAELEISIDENGETETLLEYADVHYFFNDNTTITAGKFLLPFGQFGPNLHPSWINKLPTMPGVYGHHSTSLLTPLLPIMSDTGLNIRNSFNLGEGKLFTDFYVVSGPRLEIGGHGEEPDDQGEEPDDHGEEPDDHGEEPDDHGEEPDDHGEEPDDHGEEPGDHGEFPEVDFTAKSGDNNGEMAFGGRIAYAFLPQWEVGYSFYRGAYDDDGKLDFTASSVDFNWTGTYAAIRGEWIRTTTEGFHEDGDIGEFDRNGWYLQGNWQMRQTGNELLNPFELVGRYSKISKRDGGKRWTVGVNYWLEASAALKFAFEDIELDNGISDDRFHVQLAIGF